MVPGACTNAMLPTAASGELLSMFTRSNAPDWVAGITGSD
jgi:hypothetical protein